ncbi:MAG: hypothetical protein HZA32_02475 [Opitutae bacterium]|nr:hypothetical protein [Opitutae bacterium]
MHDRPPSPRRRVILQRFGRLLRFITTAPARFRLSRRKPIRVLLDTTIHFHAVTHETAWVSTGKTNWGTHPIETGFAARIPVHGLDCNAKSFEQIRFLPGIAHLARLGYVQLLTSAELLAEQFRQPAGRFSGYSSFDLNLLSGLDIRSVDGRIVDLADAQRKQLERVQACEDPLFLSLLSIFGQANSLDAYHVLTAVRHGLTCLLHIDFKLAKNFAEWRRKNPDQCLGTSVYLPTEFASAVHLLPMAPRWLSFEDSSFPVRPDLTIPGEARRRPQRK